MSLAGLQAAERHVAPEILDELSPDDPRAQRSRRDLRRVHRAMGTARILRGAIARLGLPAPPRRVLEIGAGDGSLMLRFARHWGADWRDVELTLLDRVDVVDAATRRAYRDLGWRVAVEPQDVRDWAARPAAGPRHDLCVATLFLHHFDAPQLATLLPAIATRVDAFVACEPRRAGVARLGSRLVGALGASADTRVDAVRSVDAGFAGRELSQAWTASVGERPCAADWALEERGAGLFSQLFTALRLPASSRAAASGLASGHGGADAR